MVPFCVQVISSSPAFQLLKELQDGFVQRSTADDNGVFILSGCFFFDDDFQAVTSYLLNAVCLFITYTVIPKAIIPQSSRAKI